MFSFQCFIDCFLCVFPLSVLPIVSFEGFVGCFLEGFVAGFVAGFVEGFVAGFLLNVSLSVLR
jgi:hypothetical protein